MNVEEDGFIKATDYNAGNVHDSNCFSELFSGRESATYADSAYASQQHYEMGKARYLGLARNRTRFELMCIAYNLKRGASIQRSCV